MTPAPASLEERLAVAEGALEASGRVVAWLADDLLERLAETKGRVLAIQSLLEEAEILSAAQVDAKREALTDLADLEVEYGDNPDYEAFRRSRKIVRDFLAKDADNPPEETTT